MANYDYKCLECFHIQEESHPMSGSIVAIVCTECGSKEMEKLISSCNVHFIGDWQSNEVRSMK